MGGPAPDWRPYAADEARDAILTIGAGESMDLKLIELFLRSLRATGCRAEVVLFADARSVEQLVPLVRQYGGVRLMRFDEAAVRKFAKVKKAVVVYRFMLYEHFMRTVSSKAYRRVMHIDLFDSLFQRDPFEAVADVRDGLIVFAENPTIPMGDCRYHRYWFNQCKERPMLHRFAAVPRICMGVVMGTAHAMTRFLRIVMTPMLKQCNDQGVLNILTWNGKLAEAMPVTVLTAAAGIVLNANTEVHFDWKPDGVFRQRGDPTAFAVVHQWNRVAHAGRDGSSVWVQPKRTPLKRMQEGTKVFWSKPMQSWSSRIRVPDCAVDTRGATMVCISGERAVEGAHRLIFCPTHGPVRAANESEVGALGGMRGKALAPASAAAIAKGCTRGARWCDVPREAGSAGVVYACDL